MLHSGGEDSDDETAELMRELEKIKKERAVEEEKKVGIVIILGVARLMLHCERTLTWSSLCVARSGRG